MKIICTCVQSTMLITTKNHILFDYVSKNKSNKNHLKECKSFKGNKNKVRQTEFETPLQI